MNAHSFAVFRSITFFSPSLIFQRFRFVSSFQELIYIRNCYPLLSAIVVLVDILVSSLLFRRLSCVVFLHFRLVKIRLTSMGSYRSVAIFRILVIHKLIEFKTKNRKKKRAFKVVLSRRHETVICLMCQLSREDNVYQRAIS